MILHGGIYKHTQVCSEKLVYTLLPFFLTTGKYSRISVTNALSTPIFMDNIGCQGTENKLIECGYHTDTSEDSHSGDIWIDCSDSSIATNDEFMSSNSNDADIEARTNAALALAVVIPICFIILAIALVICIKRGLICQKMKWVGSYQLKLLLT